MKVRLIGNLYDQRVDRLTGKPVAGRLINTMEIEVEVDDSGLGPRNNAMIQAGTDWPGWKFSVLEVMT